MLYRVALESVNLIKMSSVMAAAMFAICLLALAETTNTAEAQDSLPENGKIAFTRSQGSTHYIYTVNPDGSNLSRLTKSANWESRPMWSPDGTQLTFSDDGGDVGFPVMSADGSNLRYIPTDPNVTGPRSFYPTWSADGSKLVFTSSDTPNAPDDIITMDIITMDLDGSNQVNLTKTPKKDESEADFSPDGSQICFSFEGGISLMNADGSDRTLLIGEADGMITGCDWSPDGKKIAFNDTDYKEGDFEVYVINVDGSNLTNLTTNSVGDYSPRWSPDGKKIAFESDRDGGDYDIYTMNADGSDVAPVTTNSRWHDMDPDWQPLTPKSRSMTVDPPDTGGPYLLWVAIALLFSGGVMFYAGLKRGM